MQILAQNDYILLTQYNVDTGDFKLPAGEISEMKYKVLSVGSTVTNVKKNDIIICYAEPPIKVDGETYWFTKEEAIIAKATK